MSVRVGQRKDKPGWWVFIHHRGKRKKNRFPESKEGKKEAEEFATKLRKRLDWAEVNGEYVALSTEETVQTVGTYLTEWLKVYAEPHTANPPRIAATSDQWRSDSFRALAPFPSIDLNGGM